MRRKSKPISEINAPRIPPPPPVKEGQAPTVAPIKLRTIEWQGIKRLIERGAALDEFKAQYMANQAQHAADKRAGFADLEKQYDLPQGAIERGEWSIIDGHLVCQKQQQQEQEVKTGTEG